MLRARISTATTAKPGALASCRSANFRSGSKGDVWLAREERGLCPIRHPGKAIFRIDL
jgi:hypothetical protein